MNFIMSKISTVHMHILIETHDILGDVYSKAYGNNVYLRDQYVFA